MVTIANNYLGGIFTKKDYLSPSYINLSNPKYIEIDGMYYSGLLIVNYLREQDDLILKRIIAFYKKSGKRFTNKCYYY